MTTEALNARRADPHLPYFADSIISAVMGVACIALAVPLTQLIGWNLPAEFIIGMGIFLVPWGGMNYLTSQIPQPSRAILMTNIAVDASWVFGSLLVLFMTMSSLTAVGWVVIAGQALGVLNILLIKVRGLKGFRH